LTAPPTTGAASWRVLGLKEHTAADHRLWRRWSAKAQCARRQL